MKFTVKEMIQVSIFAALTAIGAFIRIPMPYVPFTLQLFFCLMSGLIFGKKVGLWSQILYVSLGLIGLPIFTEGGGLYYIFKPTFGYLIGFVLCAYIVGSLRDKYKNSDIGLIKIFIFCTLGLMVVYTLGVLHLYVILNFYIGKAVSI
ncbi:biotin transporter BioY, partial [Clostridium sp.]|uniref:biotin transporter BioY n=1 Tax=Clostridium sp. TaxID=1506 RepID=UPI003463A1AE